jgi:hypothetical protein
LDEVDLRFVGNKLGDGHGVLHVEIDSQAIARPRLGRSEKRGADDEKAGRDA